MKPLRYVLPDGTPVPGVTDIIDQNLGWGREGLLAWAWHQGKAGKSIWDKREARVGTLAHALVEGKIKNKPVDFLEYSHDEIIKAQAVLAAFEEWAELVELEVLHSELRIVSSEWNCGGTIDLIANLNGQKTILDLKTGKQVKERDLIQISAYARLCEVELGERLPTAIVHIAADTGGLKIHRFTEEQTDYAFGAFLSLIELHKVRDTVAFKEFA